MILWEKSDCSPAWTELLSILADLAKLTEKCSKNGGLLPSPVSRFALGRFARESFRPYLVSRFALIFLQCPNV